MNKRVALVTVVLAAALVAAVFGATKALGIIGGGTFGPGGRPLSEADVRSSLAASPSTPVTSPGPTGMPSPSGSPSASPHPSKTAHSAPAARTGARSFSGNVVYASCNRSQAAITRWIPATGYSTDESSVGPSRSAFVKFKSASSEITVTVTCPGGRLQFTRSLDERGGGHGGGHGSGGGGS